MPSIFCSNKFAALVGAERLSPSSGSGLQANIYGWNAQLFYIHRKKCIIVTNKATLYSFVRLKVIKKDLANLQGFFENGLIAQLKADNLYHAQDFWTPFIAAPDFYRTDNDKKVIGSINDLIFQLKTAIDYEVLGTKDPDDLAAGSYLNRTIPGLIKYNKPLESLRAWKDEMQASE